MSKVTDIQKKIENLVTGIWTPKHDEKGHHYMHQSGIVVDSVTTKINIKQPHLVPWAARLAVESFIKNMEFYDPSDEEGAERIRKEAIFAHTGFTKDAGNIGTLAHEIVEEYMRRWIRDTIRPSDITKLIDPNMDARVFAACRSMEKFFNENEGIVPIAVELLVGDVKMKVAGTLDLLVIWNDELWLLDLKTSNTALHDDYALQVSTYKTLFQRMTGLRIKGCCIIGVSKNYDSYGIYDILKPQQAVAAFRGIQKGYDWMWNKEPKLLERKNRATI